MLSKPPDEIPSAFILDIAGTLYKNGYAVKAGVPETRARKVPMALHETYFAVKTKTVPPGGMVVNVTPLRRGRMLEPLAPEARLSRQWTGNQLVWKEYVELYYRQIRDDPAAGALLDWLIENSADRDIWLVGLEKEYPGARFLVIEVVDKVHAARGLRDSARQYADLYSLYRNLTRAEIAFLKKRGTTI